MEHPNFLNESEYPLLPGEELVAERVLEDGIPVLRAYPIKDSLSPTLVSNYKALVTKQLQSFVTKQLTNLTRDLPNTDVWSLPGRVGDLQSFAEKITGVIKVVQDVGDGSQEWAYKAIRQQLADINKTFPPVKVEGTTITATTRNPSILQGINLGRFEISFTVGADSSQNSINLKALTPVFNKGKTYYHPHIAPSGTPCLGDAHRPIQRCLEAGELFEIFAIMENHVGSYNPSSPYGGANIETWERPAEKEKCSNCGAPAPDGSRITTCKSCGARVCKSCRTDGLCLSCSKK